MKNLINILITCRPEWISRGLFVLFIILGLSPQIKASHLGGGEITCKYIGKDSYIVSITIYRDCNGIPNPDPALVVTSACNSTDTLNLKKIISKSFVPLPLNKYGKTRCQSSKSLFPYGIEKCTYTYFLRFPGTASCCFYTISFFSANRNGGTLVNTNANLYLETKINRCIINSTPVFNTDPVYAVSILNNCQTMDWSASDADGDSLSYSLTPPLQAKGSGLSYNTYYSYLLPVSFKNFPKPTITSSCGGFYLDSYNGILQFCATKTEVSAIAIKVQEWRKGTNGVYSKCGEITRDIMINLYNYSKNNLPSLSGIDNTTTTSVRVRPNTPVKFNIYSNDVNIKDSVDINWINKDMPGASFKIDSSLKYAYGTFSWTPGKQSTRQTPYTFIVRAEDDDTVHRGVCNKVYKIYVDSNLKDTLYGNISNSAGLPLKYSYLYRLSLRWLDTTLVLRDSLKLDTSGNYRFYTRDSINYLLAMPDTNYHPGELPTWYNQVETSEDGTRILASRNKGIQASFKTIRRQYITGAGALGGHVIIGHTIPPAPAVNVRLYIISDSLGTMNMTYTNTLGNFRFANLPLGGYSVLAEGIKIQSGLAPKITLTPTLSIQDTMTFVLYPEVLKRIVTYTGFQSEIASKSFLTIYPNPASDKLNISISSPIRSLRITDANGRVLENIYTPASGIMEINTSRYAAGMYFLRIVDSKGEVSHRMFMKR